MSHLVAHHRRKLRADAKHDVMKVGGTKLLQLCLLLRLAVLVNHSRSDEMLPAIELKVKNAQQWQLSISGDAKQWPLLIAELHDEQVQFKSGRSSSRFNLNNLLINTFIGMKTVDL